VVYDSTMRPNPEPTGQPRISFIEEARRRQIVDTAIRTIASRGFSRASLAEIARDAGISKGVISYHFAGKAELVEAILSRLLREPAEFIKGRVDAREGALDKLRAYVEANFEHMAGNRNHYVALVDLWDNRPGSKGDNRFNAEAYEPSRSYLARILETGRDAGELQPVPPRTFASVVQAAIDGVMLQWVFDPAGVDLVAARNEILAMIDARLTRRP